MDLTSKQRAQLRGLATGIDTILIIGIRNKIRRLFDLFLCVSHGYSDSRILNHGHIIKSVTAANGVFPGKSHRLKHTVKRICLINVFGHNFNKERSVVKKQIDFISSTNLITNKEAHQKSQSIFTINTGFFDPKNQKTNISKITT